MLVGRDIAEVLKYSFRTINVLEVILSVIPGPV